LNWLTHFLREEFFMATLSFCAYLKEKKYLITLICILALSLLLRLTFLHEPFERDEGWYAYIGQEILRGAIPYRDMIEMKPPGAFYLYALGLFLFGETKEAIRLFTALYSLLTVLTVYRTAQLVHGVRAGLIAALLYGVYSSGPILTGSSSNTEVFLVLPIVAAVFFFIKATERGQRHYLAASGFSVGCAMLIKTVALPYAAVLFVLCIFLKRSAKTVKDYLLDMLSMVGPPLTMAGFTIAYFSWHGALDDLIYWTVIFPSMYRNNSIVGGSELLSIIKVLAPELSLLTLVALPTAIWLVFTRQGLANIVLVAFIPAAVVAVLLPGMNFTHYFIQLLPPLAIVAGIGLDNLINRSGVIKYLVLAVVIGLFAYSVKAEYRFYLVYTPQQLSIAKYGPTFAQSENIAAYLKARTMPTDYIFQWGFEPELYFLANRRSPVPYLSSTFFAYAPDPSMAARLMLERLAVTKPVYFIVQPEWAEVSGGDEFVKEVMRDYEFEVIIDYALVYRRRPG
jgi:4-amino-4-deoxy-L-arabinose transferase-like glycosyltransferase